MDNNNNSNAPPIYYADSKAKTYALSTSSKDDNWMSGASGEDSSNVGAQFGNS